MSIVSRYNSADQTGMPIGLWRSSGCNLLIGSVPLSAQSLAGRSPPPVGEGCSCRKTFCVGLRSQLRTPLL